MNDSLNDKKWKSFRFDEIFDIKNGFYNKKPPMSNYLSKKSIRFIGATAFNNGVTGFCLLNDIDKTSKTGSGRNHDLKYKLFKPNCITVTNNGSVGKAYFQKNIFTCSHDVNVLYLKNHELNKHIALFLIALIERQGLNFAYARKWRPKRMKSSNIWLPLDEKDNVDYEYMEQYISKLESEKIIKSLNIVKNKLNVLKFKEVSKLSDKNWLEFNINEIFDEIKRGKRLTKNSFIEGDTPYVSSSFLNNGIDAFIGNTEKVRIFNNCLTLANSGSVGSTFYHPYSFVASDHVTKLKNSNFNKYIYLFIATMTKRLKEKYNFNREINDKRLQREVIILPSTNEGNPDYKYMEQYMINLEVKLLNKYTQYLSNKSP